MWILRYYQVYKENITSYKSKNYHIPTSFCLYYQSNMPLFLAMLDDSAKFISRKRSVLCFKLVLIPPSLLAF